MNEGNLPCAVVEDLLPIYQDGMCGGETRRLVEEHLAGCGKCAAMSAAMRATIAPQKVEQGENAIRAMRRTFRGIRVRALLLAILAAALVFAGLVALDGYLKQPHVPLSAGELDLSALYMDEEGKVYFRLGTSKYITPYSLGTSMMWTPQTYTITLCMSRPYWPYAIRTDGEDGRAALRPGWSHAVSGIWDLENARMVDGRMIAQPSVSLEEHEEMEVRLVQIGNDRDGYETLWEAGDPIGRLPEGSEVIVRAHTSI